MRWMPHIRTNKKPALVQVMACCRQSTSHYLSQCWSSSMSPYGVIGPQWYVDPYGMLIHNTRVLDYDWFKSYLNQMLINLIRPRYPKELDSRYGIYVVDPSWHSQFYWTYSELASHSTPVKGEFGVVLFGFNLWHMSHPCFFCAMNNIPLSLYCTVLYRDRLYFSREYDHRPSVSFMHVTRK